MSAMTMVWGYPVEVQIPTGQNRCCAYPWAARKWICANAVISGGTKDRIGTGPVVSGICLWLPNGGRGGPRNRGRIVPFDSCRQLSLTRRPLFLNRILIIVV